MVRNQDCEGKNWSIVSLDGGLVNKETKTKAIADTRKQIAAGTIPGPTKYSPPYPDSWKKYNQLNKALKIQANAPALVARFQ
jgi:hypothetical protein